MEIIRDDYPFLFSPDKNSIFFNTTQIVHLRYVKHITKIQYSSQHIDGINK